MFFSLSAELRNSMHSLVVLDTFQSLCLQHPNDDWNNLHTFAFPDSTNFIPQIIVYYFSSWAGLGILVLRGRILGCKYLVGDLVSYCI